MIAVPFIIGPTGIGKSDLAVIIAKRLPVEIISTDSRQIYKLLDIGTAKPPAEILERIPHHFINILDPGQYFSSGQFAKAARSAVKEIHGRGRIPLVVGGSGLYVKSLVDGIFDLEIRDEKIRNALRQRLQTEGAKALHDELMNVDPVLANRITRNDKQRIIRGLEVFILTGKTLSSFQEDTSESADFRALFFGLTINRNSLYDRINRRVDTMLEEGLLMEVQQLKNLGYHSGMNALNTVGYKEVFRYLNDELGYDEMVELIKRNTRRYAKRQYTWFNKDKRIFWYDLDQFSSLNQVALHIIDAIKRNGFVSQSD